MRITRLPVPDGYLLGIDQDGYHVLELTATDNVERRTYRSIRRCFRDRYDALTWLYRYMAVPSKEQ